MLLAAFPVLAGTTTYTYDTLDRLTRTVAGDGTVIDYSYDAAGNRTSHVVQIATFALTLAKAGTGTGTVSGGGTYAAGARVTLTATPATGSTFAGWSPSPCAASFTMPTNALTCTATFNSTASGVTLRIADVSKAEGHSGTTTANFTVTLSPVSTGTITVKYATANNGSASAGSDYTTASGTLTFTAGQTSKTVAVNVIGDNVKEANETFVVNLSAPTGATLADGQGLGTLLNDDGPVLRMVDLSKAEGNAGTSHATVKATLTPASTGTVTVKYATANGTAVAGSDYTGASGTLTFAAGQTSKTFPVPVIGDTLVETNEILLVNLNTATGATIFDNQGQVTLLNDDGPVLRIADASKTEGNTGTSPANFAVTLSPARNGTVTVKYATANGTALTENKDYSATSGTLTFAPGQTSKTVAVSVTGDKVKEPKETFVVNLSAPTGATLFDSQGLGNILNDD
ncbi:hypothetical protein CCR95_03640 [Thiocystis minor]|uniref:Calx-beta domain-containing protein n=1 Tax=Thiocystis minor TaxID=61597 RepID=UPI001914B50C|nr:Calx-beta domain-containing protein [Thiocystis minor]MBK5963204.1 hypothetical protein [Thiocystis minor]